MLIKFLLLFAMFFSQNSYPAPEGAPVCDNCARERWGLINTNPLYVNGVPTTGTIRLNFFPDADYYCLITDTYPDSGGQVWYGTCSVHPYSYFYIVKVDTVYMIHMGSPFGIYEATKWGNLYRIMELEFWQEEF